MLGLASLKESCQDEPYAHERLQHLQRLTGELGQEVHHLAWELRPTVLDDWGLQTALSNYVEEWSERYNTPVDFHSIGLDQERLAPEIEATIYRAAQEALTNILRHAEARRVSLILERRTDHVLAIVEDEGRGFDVDAVMNAAETKRWLGLLGMKERVALVGGTLQVESTLGAGTTLFIRIPV
jgi:signal transduction histidine kinase